MKSLILPIVLFLSLNIFSQLDSISPMLFNNSNVNIDYQSDEVGLFVPLNSDDINVGVFLSTISSKFSVGDYTTYVISYNDTTTYISEIYVEITTGDYSNAIVVSFSNLIDAYNSNELLTELNKVFNYMSNKESEY